MSGNENNETGKFSLSSFEGLLKILGTHGLAVFLVVYYAIYLYPDSFKERGAWITKIEELRRSINPEEKPMSSSQTESILDYVTDLYFLNVQSELPFNTYSYSTPGGGIVGGGFSFGSSGGLYQQTPPENYVEINALGFRFFIDKDKDKSEEIERVVKLFRDDARVSARETVVSTYEPMLNRALDNALKSSSRLRLFNFDDATLYELWNEIVLTNEAQFKSDLLKSFEDSQVYLQYGWLNQALRQKMNVTHPELSIPEYQRPNQVLNKYRKQMKNEWLERIKRSNKSMQPTADAAAD